MNDAQLRHRPADQFALDDVAGARGVLDEIVDERVDPPRPGVSEDLDRLAGEVGNGDHPGAQGVVDVVVDVGDPVDQADDLALERGRLGRAAGVADDPVAHRERQVEAVAVALERVDDPQRVLVVQKRGAEALAQAAVQRLLADVPERRVTEVVAEADRLDQVLVEPPAPERPSATPG